MKTTRTLLLVLIAAISLAGLNVAVQAQDTPAAPTAPAASDTPATPAGADDAPVLTEGDRSGGETGTSDSGQPAGTPTSQPGGPKKPAPSLFNPQLMLLLGAMLLFFIFMGRGKRKTAAKRKEMLSTLKKGDKVTTIGGVVGTIMEVRDDEVTVKIDENNNTRMRFARWAVRGVGADAKTEEPEDKK
ncbi:MAG: preprotein translocase subunit YajC [Phycisphaerae bacterium]|jgi:preprotein translocase subunit YajC|nr:preprotein translocase subunit YajC [Phycisphaerae bacterium]MDP7289879.1 preprotein translocase subunit YajC [Phycisphaerae bacterium]